MSLLVAPVWKGAQIPSPSGVLGRPELCAWADQTRMAGAWCILATTYTEELDINHDSNDLVAGGVVLVCTLVYNISL